MAVKQAETPAASAPQEQNDTYTAEQLRPLLQALQSARSGDFTARLPVRKNGVLGDIHRTFNELISLNENMVQEIVRVGRIVGREGRMTERAAMKAASGSWAVSLDSINVLIEDLARPTTEVARVITAVAEGDLSQKMALEIEGTPVKGEFLRIGTTVNTMVDQLGSFADEVTRVAREVGTEGKLGGQAEVKGVAGTWKDLTDNVNGLASNLTVQLRDVSKVANAIASGDLGQKITVDVKGEILQIKNVINTMVDQLSSFAAEVTRVAREVGTEGILGGQADVKGVSGTWKDLTDNVNFMAGNLTGQVRNIALVTTAVANGDLSQKITVDVKGEILELKNTINVMVDQLRSFAAEVTRVAREVGTEGKLGGQADVKGVSGTWKDLTDNVNFMAGNLTDQVRGIAKVVTAVANGDLDQKLVVEAKGEVAALADTINNMTQTLGIFAEQVTTVAREVGTEGKLGGQAKVPGVAGTWKDLTDNVNFMAGNLTGQVRNIALVTTAVANGDLSQKITVDVKGEILELKNTINTMVDQLGSFAAEVTRVAREVGTEGKLGGQADVKGVSGTWKDLTDNVNFMAGNLTNQVRNIALVTTAVANGDLSQKITVDVKGEILELKNTINTMVDQLNSFAAEVTRVAREVGTEGKLGGQAQVRGVAGTWKDLTDNVNGLASNLTVQLRDVSKVANAIASGDLGQKITVDVKGEILQIKDVINQMVDQLSSFADEVTRVAREVGTEGKLGGQAQVKGVSGTWKDLTDNVNGLASNLTGQVRNIALVTTAVANGDLSQKITVGANGEILELKNTINVMVDQLNSFAAEVTRVAREVGTEGILGGQADVKGVSGTWKDLTDNVNFMANSLTVQVRAISDVATAVTEGDLTRSITVEAQGEVSALKNNINRMIGNLKGTTQQNMEQDWLKTNLARFSGMMQGQKNLEAVARLIMSELTPLVSAHHGVFYINETAERDPALRLLSSYAYKERKNISSRFAVGEGLVGQCALEKKSILLTHVPGDYIQISSGLGEAPPLNIIVLPVLFEGDIMAVIELASFQAFSEIHRTFLDQLTESIGVVLNMISANMRTEELLAQSQGLTQELQSQSQELQSQQDQLKRSNLELETQARELEDKASLLAEQNSKVEIKNREVELARAALEEKAEQLALSSKYKSEFLANMSHELRTPLNSMLILAKLLADNKDGNLSPKQVEFAGTVHASGGDLLNLINEILDLSKVESGKMEIEVTPVPLADVQEYVERTFNHVASQKGLDFDVLIAPDAPATISTDTQRLQQVLRNLLSNAFKFTEQGRVSLHIGRSGRSVSFAVTDTGIGISKDKQNLIFEAFQQADGTTSRKYGGTGLGLSISREIARLLGGQIQVESEPGRGSVFTLSLPQEYRGPEGGLSKSDADDASFFGGDGPFETPASPPSLGSMTPFSRFLSPRPPTVSAPESAPAVQIDDDRAAIRPGDRVLLIVEDDPSFARILLDVARQQEFKGLVSLSGDGGLAMAREYLPHAIFLDLKLAGMDGWTVLDQLKRDPATRHIPVQVVSVIDRQRGTALGAISYLEKPVSGEALEGAFAHMKSFLNRDVRELLVVEDDEAQRLGIVELISHKDVAVTAVGTGEEALSALKSGSYDCVVLDLTLPDMAGFDLLKKIKRQPKHQDLPIVIYTGKDLSRQEETQLKKYAATIITKGDTSPEQLLDQTALFLHRVVADMPADKQAVVKSRSKEKGAKANGASAAKVPVGRARDVSGVSLAGRTVLVIDDDVRNIFALTSVLETQGMSVLFAENGRDGIAILEKTPGIELVLMDVMMPEMDGYETTGAIRRMPQFAALPIISLTAKAMAGDREKCLAAGASDYIPKPVDTDKLLDMMRGHLSGG